jgi:hypothetical protein
LKRRPLTVIEGTSRRGRVRPPEVATHRGGPVSAEPIVDKAHDFVQRVGLKPLLACNPPDEAVDAFDVFGAAEQRARRRRRLAETFGGFRVFLERHQVLVFRAEAVTQFRHPLVDRA